ncbi:MULTISPECIES: SH3 domain-containing protein [Clostridia]|uniref:SH3 domain-containing protein n=1 Tax=Clostridia TaxID=186801 RepID=UPI000EA827C4|nr:MULTISPECIES: SH3 domain-containing protein [Clostridia]
MCKNKKAFLSIFIITMVILQVLYPVSAWASGKNNIATREANNHLLFQTNKDINVNDELLVKKDTFLYGYKEEEMVRLEFGDTYITIPASSVNEIASDTSSPEFQTNTENLNGKKELLTKGTPLYSIEPDEQIRVILNKDSEYFVYENSLGLQVLCIGNIEYYFSEEDRLKAIKELESSTDEEEKMDESTEGEEPKEEQANENNEKSPNEQESGDDQAVNNERSDIKEVEKDKSLEDLLDKEQDKNQKDQNTNEKQLEENNVASSAIKEFSRVSKANPWENVKSKYFEVTKDSLMIYDNRSGSLRPVGELKKGQVYPRVSDYGNWHRIQYGDIYGYVKKADTIPSSGQKLKNENDQYSNQSRTFTAKQDIVVYDNTSGKLVPYGVISSGESYPIATDYGNWWRVVFADRVGYVRKSEAKIEFSKSDKYFKADGNIAVYDNRGSGSLKKVGELTKGQVYPRVSDYGNWHRIQFGNYYGYVKKSGTSFAKGNEIKNKNKNYSNQKRTFTALKSVTVYDNSSGNLTPFGKIDKGVEFSIATDYGNWWRVIFADRVGYVKKDEVKTKFLSGDNSYFRVLKENVAVYDNRSGSLKKVGELRKGQSYSILSNYGNWWRVNYGDFYGYVRKSDTGYATKKEIKNLNTKYRHSRDKIKAKQNVTVYDNSTGKLVPFGEIEKGTVYPIATNYGNWWRIVYLDRVGYIKKSQVEAYGIDKTKYDLSLSKAVNIQMTATPQTDKKYKTFVSKAYIKDGKVTATTLNVRGGPGSSYWIVGQLSKGANVDIIKEVNGWYQIDFKQRWVNASPEDVRYYLDPNNFINDERQKFQFLDLARSSDVTASVLNNYLRGKGKLAGQGQAFVDASRINGINDIYLVSHAVLETGNGTSTLARGVKYKGVTVYNMFGIGAYDSCPVDCGAKKAYEEGWTTPYKAIVGGAKFIGNGYINNGLNTLYKMRWNPKAMDDTGRFGKQYATDIGWASKQVYTMYNLYQEIGSYNLYLDVPDYK